MTEASTYHNIIDTSKNIVAILIFVECRKNNQLIVEINVLGFLLMGVGAYLLGPFENNILFSAFCFERGLGNFTSFA